MKRHTRVGASPLRSVAAAVAVLCTLPLAVGITFIATALPVGASVAPEQDGTDNAQRDVSVGPVSIAMPSANDQTSRYFWTWSKGRRGYVLRGATANVGFSTIAAYDLDSGQELGTANLVQPGDASPFWTLNTSLVGMDRVVAVDEEGGRLFVATQTVARNPTLGDPSSRAIDTAQRALSGNACLQLVVNSACFSGVSVLDAETLVHKRHMLLPTLRADGGAAAAQLVAMEYAPPAAEQPAKLHVLVRDQVHSPDAVENTGLANPRQLLTNVHYLVQFDPESGNQDWVVRLDACRGSRYGSRGDEVKEHLPIPHHAALFRGRVPGDHAVYVACHTVSPSLTVGVVRVPLDADGRPPVGGIPHLPEPSGPPNAEPGAPSAPRPPERPFVVEGPDRVVQMLADPESGRFVVQVLDGQPLAEVWWVFDTTVMQFIGTIGIGGPVSHHTTAAALAPQHGRLYVLADNHAKAGRTFEGGLFVADIRRTPVAQALRYPAVEALFPDKGIDADNSEKPMLTPQVLADGGTRLWVADNFKIAGNGNPKPRPRNYRSIEDHRLPFAPPEAEDHASRTLDIDEAVGVSGASYDGAARGYAFRALLVGGAEAAARFGPVDPVGTVDECGDPDWEKTAENVTKWAEGFGGLGEGRGGPCYAFVGDGPPDQCTQGNREVIFASVGPEGPAVVDGAGARGAAEPISMDSLTAADTEAPVSRCAKQDWDQIWGTALFGRAPAPEPRTPSGTAGLLAECVSSGEEHSDQVGDPVAEGYTARVRCEDSAASGHAYLRGGGVQGVGVAEALSSFRIYRDPGRGIVSRVESVTRGVSIEGLVRIDAVRGVAESWANGRRQPVAAEAREESYDANCDVERTAGTCFQRHLFGVRSPGYSCGPCGDEQAFIAAMNALFNPYATLRLREPDAKLRLGAENGFTAAIQKPEHERFADLVLNNDLLQTVLPTLEFVRFAPPNRNLSRLGARGRQIFQFAGVEVSSSYGIQCLLVYDEATNTCAAQAEPPGSIMVSLSDTAGKPLAGGAFEVRQDVDADGVLGLKDTLLPDGACVTADDGVGTCLFENLAPGTYLVSQVAAPPGYAKSAEPWVSEVASGEQRTVAFTNVSNVSTIDLTASDEHGAPLNGAVFAAYADPDSDGKVAPDAQPAAECTTDAQGACTMKVPAGSYVLVQTSAPGGLEGIEPVPFTFASGGQVASVSVVNYPPASPAQPEGAPSPVYTAPVDASPPREVIQSYEPGPLQADAPDIALAPSLPDQLGGTVTQVIRAPGDALRLLARDPKQAAAWTAALALFCLAVMAIRRRAAASALINGPEQY